MSFNFKDYLIEIRGYLIADFSLIYGIGLEKMSYINSIIGLSQNFLSKFLNFYYFEIISFILKIFYITDERLKSFIKQQLIDLSENKIRRGVRFFRNLPTRGQSTHRNGKQCKYLKKGEI